jgi:YVTN family beta-propeller protein
MKNRQFVPAITALLVLCAIAFLYGCGTAASGGGGSSTGGNWIYVSASTDRAISIIDGSSNTLAGTIELAPRSPYHLAASPDGKHLYVSTNSVEVVVIDTATNTISGLITTDAVTESYGMTVSANGTYLYFTRFDDSKLVKAFLKSSPVTCKYVSTTASPLGIVLADDDEKSIVGEYSNLEFFDNASFISDGILNYSGCDLYSADVKNGSVYVPRTNGAYDVVIADPTNEVQLGLITPEGSPLLLGIVSIPGENKLYVCQNTNPGKINIIDTSPTPTFEATVITGEAVTTMPDPTYMAATADGRYIYVYDTSSHDRVCVVDTITNKVIKSIPVNTGAGLNNNLVIIHK